MSQKEEESVSRHFYRRKFLIYPRAQFTVTGYLTALFFAVFGSFYFVVRRALQEDLRSSGTLLPSCLGVVTDAKAQTIAFVDSLFLKFGILGILLTWIGGILITHRLAGPVFRFRKILTQILADEEPIWFSLRKNDFFQDLLPLLRRLQDKTTAQKKSQ